MLTGTCVVLAGTCVVLAGTCVVLAGTCVVLAGTCVDSACWQALVWSPTAHTAWRRPRPASMYCLWLSTAVTHKAACTVCGHTSIAAAAHVVLATQAGALMSTGWHDFGADRW